MSDATAELAAMGQIAEIMEALDEDQQHRAALWVSQRYVDLDDEDE